MGHCNNAEAENGSYPNVPVTGIGGGGAVFDLYLINESTGSQLDQELAVPAGSDIDFNVGTMPVSGTIAFRLIVEDYTINETGNHCTSSQVFADTVYRQPIAGITVLDPELCEGELANIVVQVSNSDGNQFVFSNNENGVNQHSMRPFPPNQFSDTIRFVPPSLTYGSSSQFYVYDLIYLEDNYGCAAHIENPTDSLFIHPTPYVGFIEDNLAGCAPLAILFTDTTVRTVAGSPITEQYWEFGNGNSSSEIVENESQVYLNGGSDTKEIQVTLLATNVHGCSNSASKIVSVYPDPEPYFTMEPYTLDIINNEAVFLNKSILNTQTNSWIINGDTTLTTSDLGDFEYVFESNAGDEFEICLESVSPFGCIANYCLNTVIRDIEVVYIPNSFSPDGDGLNEVFKPVISSSIESDSYLFQIFDRWGQVVFSTRDVNEGWNGCDENGAVLPIGTYVYSVGFRGNVRPIQFYQRKGQVTKLR